MRREGLNVRRQRTRRKEVRRRELAQLIKLEEVKRGQRRSREVKKKTE